MFKDHSQRTWLPCSIAIAILVALVTVIYRRETQLSNVLLLLALWAAHRGLRSTAIRLTTSTIVVVVMLSLILTYPASVFSWIDSLVVLLVAIFISFHPRDNEMKVSSQSLSLIDDFDLPSDGDFDTHTMSLDGDADAVANLSKSEISGKELLARMSNSQSFVPKQISRIEAFLRSNQERSPSLGQLIQADLLTAYQALHLHWGREDQLRFDRYSFIEMIGSGGMSTVFRAINMQRGETVAIKLLSTTPKAISRAQREMEIAKQLSHKNIVVAYDSGQVRNRYFIEMEYVSGSDLHKLVKRNGPLCESQALLYALQIARGLQHAHSRGLIHRDVKPSNVLVTSDGTVKITDLGLAIALGLDVEPTEFKTNPHRLVGTIEFMSPEQALGEVAVDERTDIFSFGSTLFFLLTGRSRLIGDSVGLQITNLITKRRFHCPRAFGVREEVALLIELLCKHKPSQRLQSMTEVIYGIESLIGAGELSNGIASETIRVLIVEDNPDDLYAARRMLGQINRSLQTIEATTLAECLSIIDRSESESPIDVVLLDLYLSDTVSFDTIDAFRQAKPHLPLVVMSGLDDPNYGQRCIEAGANDFLPKNNANAENLERVIFMTLARYRIKIEEGSGVRMVKREPKT